MGDVVSVCMYVCMYVWSGRRGFFFPGERAGYMDADVANEFGVTV